jgi:hypothetical protein
MKEKRLQTAAVPKRSRLAAEVGNEPKQKREKNAEEQAGHDGKVERGVRAAVDDVAGQFSEAKREPVAEIKKDADQNEERSKADKRAAEFAERIHRLILTWVSVWVRRQKWWKLPILNVRVHLLRELQRGSISRSG